MISTPDRRNAVTLIDEAVNSGARRPKACAELGISDRTYRRWTAEGEGTGEVTVDQRPFVERPTPANALSNEERQAVLDVCNEPEFASLPPSQIVPRLADRGVYLASEATVYRLLRAAGQAEHRGRAKAPVRRAKPTSHKATGPCQVWCWDITWVPGPIRGLFFYLYLIVDIYSRKIVGWEVYASETAEQAAALVRRAVLAEGCITSPLVLHADNGSPMKGATMTATLEALGILASFSRPRVSNDNPFSEALFRTCKYRPEWPPGNGKGNGFEDIGAARAWVRAFVAWYNTEHRHSALRFVTPDARHRGEEVEILRARGRVYEAARAATPTRWSGPTRCWEPVGPVWLNPDKDATVTNPATTPDTPMVAAGGLP
jgi:transposase InsO family protein